LSFASALEAGLAKHYFVTSTGTGIGKTFVTAALIRQARARQWIVAATKPVISGFDKQEIAASDSGALLAALGRELTLENVEKISPWRYAAPLAPNMAARAEGKVLDCSALFAFSRAALEQKADLILIEGVGGVMVPLDDENTVMDWIAALGAPVLLVVGDYLGTISHTLTALAVLRAQAADVAAIVVNEGEGASVAFEDSLAEIAKWVAPVPVFGLRRGGDGAALAPLLDLS
jgi:dethiobiotin synthetase